MKVIAAYKTDHFPLGGNISEEIFVVEDGWAIFLTPDHPDTMFPTLEEAIEHAIGTATFSQSLLDAWKDTVPITSLSTLTHTTNYLI